MDGIEIYRFTLKFDSSNLAGQIRESSRTTRHLSQSPQRAAIENQAGKSHTGRRQESAVTEQRRTSPSLYRAIDHRGRG
jgi:hypothetical protein